MTTTARDEEWVLWNGLLGVLTMVAIGRIEVVDGVRTGWLERPWDMVGPFSMEALATEGRIAFAQVIVMSRLRWQHDQVELRREAMARRRAAQERAARDHARFGDGPGWPAGLQPGDERRHRETLHLPADGTLDAAQIKAAFRRLAQKAHPDTGGSHEAFIRLSEARNALLDAA